MNYLYWITIPALATLLTLATTKSYLSQLSIKERSSLIEKNHSLLVTQQLNSQTSVTNENTYSQRSIPHIASFFDHKIQQQQALTQQAQASRETQEEELELFWDDFEQSIEPIINQRLTPEQINQAAAEQSGNIAERLQLLTRTLDQTKQDRSTVEGTQVIGDLLKNKQPKTIISNLNQTHSNE